MDGNRNTLKFLGIAYLVLGFLLWADEPVSAQGRDRMRPPTRARGGFPGGWRGPWRGERGGMRANESNKDIFPGNSFTFCRVQYLSYDGRGWDRGGNWRTDFPDSDINFSMRLEELTTIKVNRDEKGEIEHAVVRLTDKELFNYPFIYMLQVENISFSKEEGEALRSYLLKGGFLHVDDFWGTRALEWFQQQFEEYVFPPEKYPECRIMDIRLDHPIFHIVFDIKEVPQIPGLGFWQGTGQTSERGADSAVPHCKGVFDKDGRLMVVITHNTDLGDGWEEEAQDPEYFREFSAKKAYPLGINIVVYAMTH